MEQEQQPSALFKMEVDMIAEDHLRSVAKWGKFISVAGFVVIALTLLLMLVGGQRLLNEVRALIGGSDEWIWITIAVMVVAIAMYGTWFYFLFRASALFNKAVSAKSSADLAEGFACIRNFFVISIVLSCLSIAGTLLSMINL